MDQASWIQVVLHVILMRKDLELTEKLEGYSGSRVARCTRRLRDYNNQDVPNGEITRNTVEKFEGRNNFKDSF